MRDKFRERKKIERLREQLSNVNADINVTNKSLWQLRKILKEEEHEPILEDYYLFFKEM